jgi:predicted RNA-binding Zn-ribbon protein involved in translation (DUF1610 family)
MKKVFCDKCGTEMVYGSTFSCDPPVDNYRCQNCGEWKPICETGLEPGKTDEE